MDWDAVKREWLNPNHENVYFPLPLVVFLGLVTVLWLNITGGVAGLALFAVLYCVWTGVVVGLMAIGSRVLSSARRSRLSPTTKGALDIAIPVVGIYLAYRAALLLAEVADTLM